jgi:hypothetical protein
MLFRKTGPPLDELALWQRLPKTDASKSEWKREMSAVYNKSATLRWRWTRWIKPSSSIVPDSASSSR